MGTNLTSTEYNRDVLQEGRWTQEVIAGTNTDKIPDAALAAGIDGGKLLGGTVYDSKIATGINGAKVTTNTLPGGSIQDLSIVGTKMVDATLDGATKLYRPYDSERALVTHNANQFFANGATLGVGFNTTVSNKRFTIAYTSGVTTCTVLEAGYYLISVSVMWDANATGNRVLAVMVGATIKARAVNPGHATIQVTQQLAPVVYLAVSDVVQINAYQDSGVTLGFTGTGANSGVSPYLHIVRVA